MKITKKDIAIGVGVILASAGLSITPILLVNQIPSELLAHREVGIPYHESPIVEHFAYSILYSEKHEQPIWVAYTVTADRLENKCFKRTNNFKADPDVITGSATLKDYAKSGYDRGHLCPAAVNTWSKQAMDESFYLSNMSPQVAGFNRGIWKKLESYVRSEAGISGELYVVCGGIFNDDIAPNSIGTNNVTVPDQYYKVLLDLSEVGVKTIGFILPNRPSKDPLASFAVSVDKVEEITGIDFYHTLNDDLEDEIESEYDIAKWHLQ